MSERIAIIGGGISGLAAARRLRRLRPDAGITIFERRTRFGGTIHTERVDDLVIEAGPDAFLAIKPRGVGLSEELGIAGSFVSPAEQGAGAFILHRGRLLPLPPGLTNLAQIDPVRILRSPLLSVRGKARLVLEPLIRPRLGTEDESVSSFFDRRLGRSASRNLMEPLLTGIYGGDGERLSLAATFANWRAAELTHGSLTRGMIAMRRESRRRGEPPGHRQTFISFRDGMAELTGTLCRRLAEARVELVAGATACAVDRNDRAGSFTVTIEQTGGPAEHRFDAVVLAVPAAAAAGLVSPLDRDAGQALGEIPHISTAIIVAALPRADVPHPLVGSGYISPNVDGRPVMAMTWLSSKWANRAPADQVLLRGFIGRSGQQYLLNGDDDALIRLMRSEMREVLGVAKPPHFSRVYRWIDAMPHYTLGHHDRVRRIRDGAARVPGLEIAGNMLQGVGIPDCIASGEAAAANTATYLGERERAELATATS